MVRCPGYYVVDVQCSAAARYCMINVQSYTRGYCMIDVQWYGRGYCTMVRRPSILYGRCTMVQWPFDIVWSMYNGSMAPRYCMLDVQWFGALQYCMVDVQWFSGPRHYMVDVQWPLDI